MEINTSEIYDPRHLSLKDQDCIKNMAEAKRAGVDDPIEDDFLARGLVNGYILLTLGQNIDEPGYGDSNNVRTEKDFELSPERKEELLEILKARFEANRKRHKHIEWAQVEAKINQASFKKLWSLNEMERTGGEPDVVDYLPSTDEYEFCDCASESPHWRRNISYDRESQLQAERHGLRPSGNAVDMAANMGIEMLNEEQLRKVRRLCNLNNTKSWIKTPDHLRELGIALIAYQFCGQIEIREQFPYEYNNRRGFRGLLKL